MITDPLQIVAILLGVIFISLKIVEKSEIAAKISPIMWILFLAAFISNTGIIDNSLPLFGQINDFVVPFAVSLILLQVRLSDLSAAGKPILAAFAIACIATMIGAMVAGITLNPIVEGLLGSESWKLAGPYTGTYVGGNMNFFAVWEGLEIGNSDLFAAANAVDNIMTFVMFLIWLSVPSLLGKYFKVKKFWALTSAKEGEDEILERKQPKLNPTHVVTLAFTAISIVVVSNLIKQYVFVHFFPQVPTILIITTVALILGQLKFFAQLEGAFELGNIAFYLFFASIGAMMNIVHAVIISPYLFLYVVVIMVVHMVLIYGAGRILGMDISVLTVASCAAKAGPPSVIALTQAKGWKKLVLPGVVMGLLGYALGNYLGFGAAYLVKILIGG